MPINTIQTNFLKTGLCVLARVLTLSAICLPAVAQNSGSSESTANGIELQDIEVFTSDDAAQISLIAAASGVAPGEGRYRFSFLTSEERDNVFMLDTKIDARPLFTPSLNLQLAARLYAGLLAAEDTDAVGLAPGLEASFDYPTERFPLHIRVGGYYAPDVFTFGQSDRIVEYFGRVGLRVSDALTGFVGFRFLQFDTRPGDREVDDQVHIGIRWQAR